MGITIFFDPISHGFYQTNIHKLIPTSSIEISQQQYRELIDGQAIGKEIAEVGGEIILVERKVSRSTEEFNERAWRNLELFKSDMELNKLQDGDAKAFGTVTLWRAYRKLLRNWPQDRNFPSAEFRPQPPNFKE